MLEELGNHLPRVGVKFAAFVTGGPDLVAVSGGLFRAFCSSHASVLTRVRRVREVVGKAIKRDPPDVVASHFALYAWPLLARIRGIPHVVHFHGPWAAESVQEGGGRIGYVLKRAIERRVYRRADRLIVLSQAFRTLAIEQYGVSPGCIRVIPGSVDIARFAVSETRAEARERLDLPQDRPILITVRRLVQRMGLQNLVEALAIVCQTVPDVLLLIGGTGVLRDSLEQQVRETNLSGNVKFLGFVPDESLALAYRAADINLVPTLALEGFGLVAAEAMAGGTPSMVTPVGGLPEVVSGLSPLLVFPSTAPKDIAASLIAVLTKAIFLPSDESCRAYTAEHFSSELMAGRVAAVYHEVIGHDI